MIISFDDYKKRISDYIDKNELILYRGQSSCDWNLEPTFSRFCSNNGERFDIDHFNLLLGDFINEASCFLEKDLTDTLDYLQKVALAQHYGLPTPFLDWTDSPYIATFFAIANRTIKDTEPFRIWALKVKKNADYYLQNAKDMELEKDFYIVSTKFFDSKRLRRQRGYFSYLRKDMALEEYLEKNKPDIKLVSYDICGDSWLSIMRELRLMGISHNNLFDNLDGIATDVSLDFLHNRRAGITLKNRDSK